MIYATITQLRTELGVTSTELDDAAATRLIDDAEDLVDAELGRRPIDPLTGRAVNVATIAAWQLVKLRRATVKLAALLFYKPDLASEQRWKMVSGPDFTFSGTDGPLWGSLIVALIDATRLRRAKGAYSIRTPPPPDDLYKPVVFTS